MREYIRLHACKSVGSEQAEAKSHLLRKRYARLIGSLKGELQECNETEDNSNGRMSNGRSHMAKPTHHLPPVQCLPSTFGPLLIDRLS